VTLVLLALCGWAIYPPEERIRLGKDLRGGTSLVYAVDIPQGADADAVLTQVITVLKDRVNPQGVLDISMRPLGNDRIEIVMPLPSPEVQELRKAYDQALQDLVENGQIIPAQLDQAVHNDRAVEVYAGGDTSSERGQRLAELQQAYNDLLAAREQLAAARESDAAETQITALETEVANAEITYEQLRSQVLDLSLNKGRIVRTLNLPTEQQIKRNDQGDPILDEQTGEPVMQPSPRAVAIENLKSEFPHLAQEIDQTVEAFDAFQAKRKGYDDPQDLMRLLRGAGVLEYHIAVTQQSSQNQGINVSNLRQQLQERGPKNTDSLVARWYPINDLEQWYDTPEQLESLQADPVSYFRNQRGLIAADYNDQYYLLLFTTPGRSLTHEEGRDWSVQETSRTVDQLGRPAVSFRLDTSGALAMGQLTGGNIGEPMAIVLDGEVYSAPNIQSQITSQGQITGQFSTDELDYLTKVLAAGSLEARLSKEPIAVNTLGPSIGADNLRRGREAFIIAIIAVAIFMLAYYFFAGFVADLALIANGLIIFGLMSLLDATFTMPGLAGIVLTIGMAVDANVLIYERIREEIFAGEEDLRTAIRLGYSKALSTILDANVTNLIVCLVLARTATTEVKGFAVTLSIGICATLFTALIMTRVIYTYYTDVFKRESLPMLPTVFPAIHRLLEPNIRWISLRPIFWTISAIAVVGSITMVSARGVNMLDTELRGGVTATMQTARENPDDPESPRLRLQHIGPDSVNERVRGIADKADPEMIARFDQVKTDLEQAEQALADARQNNVSDQQLDELQEERAQARSEYNAVMRHAVMREFQNASVLTVGETFQDASGAVTATKFQIKVPSPRGLEVQDTITDIVRNALVQEFGDQLDVVKPLDFAGADNAQHAAYTFPIEHESLGQNIERPGAAHRVADHLGGVAIVLEDIEPAVSPEEIRLRVEGMRRQPDFSDIAGRNMEVFGLQPAVEGDPSQGFTSAVVVVSDPAVNYERVDFNTWDQRLAQLEWELVRTALTEPAQLEQVSSYSAAVAQTLKANAVVAVAVTLLAVLAYIWVRFGMLRYSLAAVAALVHDVLIALGLLAATAFVAGTAFGSFLLIEEFRIDLGVIAALLTIVGYSLNDTIVVLDRIRENRGKLPLPTAPIVNKSINQTVSRTLLTSVTTLLAVAIMYFEGGSGIRSFTYTLLIGLVVGTYSSVAIAAPLVFRGKGDERTERERIEQRTVTPQEAAAATP